MVALDAPRHRCAPAHPGPTFDGLQGRLFSELHQPHHGPRQGDAERDPLHAVTTRLLTKARCGVVFPRQMNALCCGTPFESKGFKEQADAKARELEAALLEASAGGRLPVLVDTSPCLYRMQQVMAKRLTLLDPVEFTLTYLLPRLEIVPVAETIA
jgi:D-lactate dehydrogenase